MIDFLIIWNHNYYYLYHNLWPLIKKNMSINNVIRPWILLSRNKIYIEKMDDFNVPQASM